MAITGELICACSLSVPSDSYGMVWILEVSHLDPHNINLSKQTANHNYSCECKTAHESRYITFAIKYTCKKHLCKIHNIIVFIQHLHPWGRPIYTLIGLKNRIWMCAVYWICMILPRGSVSSIRVVAYLLVRQPNSHYSYGS